MPLHDGQVGSLPPIWVTANPAMSPAGYMFLCSPHSMLIIACMSTGKLCARQLITLVAVTNSAHAVTLRQCHSSFLIRESKNDEG